MEFRFDPGAVDVPPAYAEASAGRPAQVWVAGDFNGWDASELGLTTTEEGFVRDVPLFDGVYAYKFRIVDELGNEYWRTDPANPYYAPDDTGGVNSLLAVENGSAAPGETIPGLELFEIRAPLAKWVNVAGDFNVWHHGVDLHEQEPGIWRCWIRTPRPIQYKFIVDGVWRPDPSPDAAQRRDGMAGVNSLRPAAADLPDPEQWTMDDVEAMTAAINYEPGEEIELSWQYAADRDYTSAMALLESVLRNAPPDDLRAEALWAEAEIHCRFGYRGRAARSWERIVAELEGAEPFKQAAWNLARHRHEVEQNGAGAREIYGKLLALAADGAETAAAHYGIAESYKSEGDWSGALQALHVAFAAAPPAEQAETGTRLLLTEMWMSRGYARWNLGKFQAAVQAYRQAIKVCPWPDSENAQLARRWIERIKADAGVGGPQ